MQAHRSRHRKFFAAGLGVLVVACLPSESLDEAAVINGEVCTDSVARSTVALRGDAGCTGTLIDDRLVMTARHCFFGREVPDSRGSWCQSDGTPDPAWQWNDGPKAIDVYIVVDADAPPIARGRLLLSVGRELTPCNGDVAFVVLDRTLPNMTPAALSSSAVVGSPYDESHYVIAGYGLTEPGKGRPLGTNCGQTEVSIEFPHVDMSSRGRRAQELEPRPSDVHPGGDEFVYSEGTCHGDSGGPIYRTDETGEVLELVGVVSRMVSDDCDGSAIAADVSTKTDWIEWAQRLSSDYFPSFRDLPLPGRGPDGEAYPDVWRFVEHLGNIGLKFGQDPPVGPVYPWRTIHGAEVIRQDLPDGSIIVAPLETLGVAGYVPHAFLTPEVLELYEDIAIAECLGLPRSSFPLQVYGAEEGQTFMRFENGKILYSRGVPGSATVTYFKACPE